MQPHFPPDLEGVRARYAALPLTPLEVAFELSSPMHAPDAPSLDGLLAAAVVRRAYGSSLVPDVPEGHSPVVPVPLGVLWCDERGLPFHACTPFRPGGEVVEDVTYHHKRHQPGRFTRRTKSGRPFAVTSTDGRWMDRQRPLRTVWAERFACTAVGNLAEIEALLTLISAVAKERGRGLGAVTRWHLRERPAFSLVEDGRLAANVPLAAAEALGLAPEQHLTLGAWTPPRWQNGLYALVYPEGTPCREPRALA